MSFVKLATFNSYHLDSTARHPDAIADALALIEAHPADYVMVRPAVYGEAGHPASAGKPTRDEFYLVNHGINLPTLFPAVELLPEVPGGQLTASAAQRIECLAGYQLMLYGFRDSIEIDSDQRLRARQYGHQYQFAEIEFEVGDIEEGLIGLDRLGSLRFANVKRMNAETQRYIQAHFNTFLQEGQGASKSKGIALKEMALHPALFCRLLETDPLFARLEVLVIPVFDGERVRQLALVTRKAQPTSLSQDETQGVQIALDPAFFTTA